MTKLFEEAVTKASTELNPHDQDRFAQFLLAHIGNLHDLIDDVIEEYVFERNAIAAIELPSVQKLLKQVADKYQARAVMS